MSRVILNYSEARGFLQDLVAEQAITCRFDERRIVWRRPLAETDTCLELPRLFPEPRPDEPPADYAARIPDVPDPYVILLIRAGQAALGYWRDGELERHKVIRKYMVRKKQGRAQITHRKRKGKSRLGSRIRLAQSLEFFVEINQYLTDWLDRESEVERVIHYSAPVRLWPFVFESKQPPPFAKGDPRLRWIPLHVHTPDFAELQRINRWLSLAKLGDDEV